MIRLRYLSAYWLKNLGWPGWAGAGLAAFAALFTIAAIVPSAAKLEQVRLVAKSARETLKQMAQQGMEDQGTPETRLAAFYRFFPARADTPDWLEKIYAAAARQPIILEQGEYKLLGSQEERLLAYQITLPVKGTYLQVRNFVAEMLNEVPAAALEDVTFQRQAIGGATVEAKVRLTLYLRAD